MNTIKHEAGTNDGAAVELGRNEGKQLRHFVQDCVTIAQNVFSPLLTSEQWRQAEQEFCRAVIWEPAGSVWIPCDLPLPPKELHPNGRPKNRQQRDRLKAAYRKEAGELAFACCQERPRLQVVTLQLVYQFEPPKKHGRRQGHDPDNLIAWAKTAVDALTDAGILADDKEATYLPPRQQQGERNALRITVTARK